MKPPSSFCNWPKQLIKQVIARSVSWRIACLPLNARQADKWAVRIKRWPAVFQGCTPSRRVVLPFGAVMDVGVTDHIERHLLTHGVWDEHVASALRHYLAPGDTFLDLGANIGYFSLMASRLVGEEGLVVSVEPSIRALRKLTHHLHLNGCTNVIVMSLAAGQEKAVSALSLASEGNIGASCMSGAHSQPAASSPQPSREERVLCCSLDELFDGTGVAPTMIKLDLEGYESLALKGLRRLLHRCRPRVICEVTDSFLRKFGASSGELITWMREQEYEAVKLEMPHGSSPSGHTTLLDHRDPPREQMDVLFRPIDGNKRSGYFSAP